jgi:hypothetical protein
MVVITSSPQPSLCGAHHHQLRCCSCLASIPVDVVKGGAVHRCIGVVMVGVVCHRPRVVDLESGGPGVQWRGKESVLTDYLQSVN